MGGRGNKPQRTSSLYRIGLSSLCRCNARVNNIAPNITKSNFKNILDISSQASSSSSHTRTQKRLGKGMGQNQITRMTAVCHWPRQERGRIITNCSATCRPEREIRRLWLRISFSLSWFYPRESRQSQLRLPVESVNFSASGGTSRIFLLLNCMWLLFGLPWPPRR